MNHRIKVTLLGLLLVGLGVTWATVYFISDINANSDYVCYKTSTECSECTWTPWDPVSHSRECTSSLSTTLHWGNTRTGCSKQDMDFGYDSSYRYGTEVVSSTICEVKTQTDTALPTCETKAEDGNFYLRCLANGPADCVDFVDWEEVPYAQPGESKIVGIGTEAGNYEGCVIPEQS